MALFWKRKNKERYITLGLNQPAAPESTAPPALEPPAATVEAEPLATATYPEPVVTGDAPTPPTPTTATKINIREAPPPLPTVSPQPIAVASRSPFASSSILGLNRSMEELQAEEAALEQAFAVRFRRAVAATRESLSDRLDTVFQNRKQIDAELLDELEEVLIAADIGVPTTMHILETVRRGVARKQINDVEALKAAIKSELLDILRASQASGIASETSVPENIAPYVIMVVGVNGVGKTTTIGKLAQRIKAEGNDVLICAADTFRAAASDQLAIWAERTGVPLMQQREGTDPAAVLFDSLKAAKARNSDVLIVDTAGRLHNKSNLMAELEKMKRVAGREVEAAPHETLLVLDAVTGQNGLEQARQFLKVAGVTGIVLTKLDGTAKGGIAIAIAKELRLPIRYVGIGEKVDDLVVFDPEHYVNSLFE
ncbi:MAG: signal recognition particle-docking protein FtsY [Pyrinomonadaceae bacterium]